MNRKIQSIDKRRRYGRYLVLVCFLLTLPLLSWSPATNVAGGDGTLIYAYLRSAIMDGDLQFENEFRYRWPVVGLYGWIRNAGTDRIIHSVDPMAPSFKDDPSKWGETYGFAPFLFGSKTATGHIANHLAPGPAFLWLPFFLLGHAMAWGANAIGWHVAMDGFSLPYSVLVSLGSAITVLGSLLLIYEVLLEYVRPWVTTAAVLLVYLASPLVVYAIQTPISPHGPAAFASALFLYMAIRARQGRSCRWYTAWGASGGLLISIRFEAGVLLILAGLMFLQQAICLSRRLGPRRASLSLAQRWTAFVGGLILGLLPMMIIGQIVYGFPWVTYYPAVEKLGYRPGNLSFLSPHWWDVLWSTNKGLFTWHPILLVATVGLFLLWRKDRLLAAASLLALVAQVYVIGSWEFWDGLTGFGQRYFVNLVPVFMIGLGVLLDRALHWLDTPVVIGLGSPFVVWNLGLFIQYGLGLIPRIGGFEWSSVFYNQFVFIPNLIWKRILLPLSPWSFLLLGMGAVLLLASWIWWNRRQKWQPAG